MRVLRNFLLLLFSVSAFAQTTLYNAIPSTWKANTSSSVNPVPADAYVSFVDSSGRLNVINQASKELAGGLVSTDIALPAGATYFGLDVVFDLSADDLAHYARGENDLKVTYAGGAQANGSCEWNASTGQWQLDPTGAGWVNTGFTQAPIAGRNELQLRITYSGTWSVTGIRFNGTTFTPGPQFQNLAPIKTNWAAGLHPQLQMEAQQVPWYLRETYERVRVLSSSSPIPWVFD